MIDKNMILLDKNFKTKEELLAAYCEVARNEELVENENNFLKALWDRETILPTSVGKNIAIPHCQSETVKEPFVGLIRNKNLVQWDEQEKVNLIFVIAIPEKTSGQIHLKTLAKLSRKLIHQEFVETLLQADYQTSFEILKETLEEE